jgi:FkbM family methyltransferase
MPGSFISPKLRRAFRAPLRRVGFDIVRYDAARTPERRRMRLIIDRRVDLVLDVGANTGPFARTLRDAGYGGRIVSFEPQRAAFDELQAACSGDLAWECQKIALGSIDGEVELHLAGNSSSSSLLQMTERHVTAAPESRYVGSERVAVRRLDTIRDEVSRREDIVYLKADVQGFELEVLRGAEQTLEQVTLAEVELSLTPLYRGSPTLADVVDYLEKRDFELLGLETVLVSRDGVVLQVDGMFGRLQR